MWFETDGIISTYAGMPWQNGSVNNVPATQGKFGAPFGMALSPDGDLVVADYSSVRRLHPSLSGFTADQIVIPSDDGREVFVFDGDGRHLRTVDALTGSVVYSFGYDVGHRLISVTDPDGNVTTIERDGSGDATAIVSPDGQRTVLAMDGSGHVAAVSNPAGETHAFTYTPEGLLTSMTDPRANTSTYTDDELGRLVNDTDAAGGFIALSRTETLDHLEVSATTAEGRTTTYTINQLPTGDESRTVSEGACCAESETINGRDGSTTTTSRDGTVTYTLEGPDPRFGMNAPIVATSRVTLPSGLVSATTASRTAVLSNPLDPFSLTSQTDTVTVNGKTTTTVYSASTWGLTTSSALAGAITTFPALRRRHER